MHTTPKGTRHQGNGSLAVYAMNCHQPLLSDSLPMVDKLENGTIDAPIKSWQTHDQLESVEIADQNPYCTSQSPLTARRTQVCTVDSVGLH